MVEKGGHNRVRVYLTKSDEVQEMHVRYEVRRLYKYPFVFSLVCGVIWLAFNSFNHLMHRKSRLVRFD